MSGLFTDTSVVEAVFCSSLRENFLVEIVKDGISDVVKIKQNNGINLGKNDDDSYKILNLNDPFFVNINK